ncbi:MAG: flagellin [Lachnospiraceae bacterium]|nr:flagellin [Lachnospiraceae bacterium]
MKINYNMSAYVANAHLLRNEDALTASLEKLSSGYRINHASDDPAGKGLSAKMRTQIRGLEQANRNAADGESVIETAEGALQEVTSMLQRMRELSVQAGNDTYSLEDKEAMQEEIKALIKEVDRVSTDTEFNKKTLLDGSLNSRVYADTRNVSLISVTDDVPIGDYKVKVTEDATRAVYTVKPATEQTSFTYKDEVPVLDENGDPVIENGAVKTEEVDVPITGTMTINNVAIAFDGTEKSAEEIFEKIRKGAEQAEVNVYAYDGTTAVTDANKMAYPESAGYEALAKTYEYAPTSTSTSDDGNGLVFVSKNTGSSEKISIKCSDEHLAAFFGLTTTDELSDTSTSTAGTDVKIELVNNFSKQATVATEGEKVTITDVEGFKMMFDVDEISTYTTDTDGNVSNADLEVTLNVTNIGNMALQIGANQYQTISVNLPDVSTKALRIDDIDVTTKPGPAKALKKLDDAIAQITSARSGIGAAENRLSSTENSLGQTDENMNAALSRIEDVDMAQEMSTYTQMNVLVQAATSVLAQANDLPEQTLQLLQ